MIDPASTPSGLDHFTGEVVNRLLAASTVLLLTVPPPPPPPSGPKHPPFVFIIPDTPAPRELRRPTYRPVH